MTLKADLVLDVKDQTGECPTWVAEEAALWWTDINGSRLHRYEPGSGRRETFRTEARVGCFAVRRGGGLVVAMEHTLGLLDPRKGALQTLASVETELPRNRFNDGRCDRRGRLFAGTMNEARDGAKGALWRLEAGRAPERVADGVAIANGLAWSPDDRVMYWADSPTSRVWQFDYDIETGSFRNRRLWLEERAEQPGFPDGAAVDSDGCYWSARFLGGRVIRFTPDGRVDREVLLPVSRVTMCAFGGPGLRTLYITTAREGMAEEDHAREPLAGGLFAVDVGIAGLPEPRFAG
jgi:sugar lactone lactonase YvrE